MNRDKIKLIYDIAKKAQEDWRTRHFCLPSLVVAMALHDMEGNNFRHVDMHSDSFLGCPELFPLRRDGHRGGYLSVEEAVLSHNTYLAGWKEREQERPNWEELAGQKHYILAVQCLQDAQYPYYPTKEAEAELVELIERNGLGRFDVTVS